MIIYECNRCGAQTSLSITDMRGVRSTIAAPSRCACFFEYALGRWEKCSGGMISIGVEGTQGSSQSPGSPSLDPKGEAGKLKPQLQLIPPALNRETALALVEGHKYGPWNWRGNKVEIMTYLGAMKRHIDKIIDRVDADDIDPASGAHHCGHIAAGCGIILDALQHGTLVDNRPPPKP